MFAFIAMSHGRWMILSLFLSLCCLSTCLSGDIVILSRWIGVKPSHPSNRFQRWICSQLCLSCSVHTRRGM
jgi:hypothetical protein